MFIEPILKGINSPMFLTHHSNSCLVLGVHGKNLILCCLKDKFINFSQQTISVYHKWESVVNLSEWVNGV